MAGRGSRVLVRDTRQDGASPVLRFSPAAWRRSGQALVTVRPGNWVRRPPVSGALVCEGAPFGFVRGGSSLARVAGCRGRRRSGVLVLVSAAAAIGAISKSCVAPERVLERGKGRERVRGYQETRGWEVSRKSFGRTGPVLAPGPVRRF